MCSKLILAYPCGFPGCTRTFGVRSNARRHLRTHGVIPGPSQPPGPSEPPYVVGFDTPTILPPQNTGRGAQSPEFYRVGVDGRRVDEAGQPIFSGQRKTRDDHHAPSTRVPTFKVRWMPLSLDTRTDPLDLHAIDDPAHARATQDQDITRKDKERWHGDEAGEYYDEDDESAQSRMNMDDEREEDEEDDMYRPLRPTMPSSHSSSQFTTASASSTGSASVSGSNMLISSIVDQDAASNYSLPGRPVMSGSQYSASFGPSRSSIRVCRCSPPCPGDSSSMINCRVLGPIYPASISPSMSAHSFATPSPSTSTSPINLPGGYSSADGYDSVSHPSSHSNSQSGAPRYEERDPYIQAGSRPYPFSEVNIPFS